MRLLVFLSSFLLLGSCHSQPKNNHDSNQVSTELIGVPLETIAEYQQRLGLQLSLDPIAILSGDYNYDGILDTLRFMKISDWGDPGDFHQIEFTISGEAVKEFFNGSGWVSPLDVNQVKINRTGFEQLDYGLKFLKNKESTLFVFYGYPYASSPWLTSIVKVGRSGVELIFNDNKILYKIDESKISFVKVFLEDITPGTPINSYSLDGLWLRPLK